MWMGGVDKQAVVCDPDLASSPLLTHPTYPTLPILPTSSVSEYFGKKISEQLLFGRTPCNTSLKIPDHVEQPLPMFTLP